MDYALLSWTGYLAYSLYNIILYTHPNDGRATVQDLVFAIHGWVLVNVTLIQCAYYDVFSTQNLWRRTSFFAKCVTMSLWLLVPLFFFLETKGVLQKSAYFSAIKWLGYMKVCTTTIKYAPQVYLNWYRGSTQGWSRVNILCDFLGGVLSVAQMILDSADTGNWNPDDGFNVAKFTLGFVTITFDITFAYQFYRYRFAAQSDTTTDLLSPKQPL